MIVIVSTSLFDDGAVAARARREALILRAAYGPVTLVTTKVPAGATEARRRLEEFRATPDISVLEITERYLRGPWFNVSKDAFFNFSLGRVLLQVHARTPVRLVAFHGSTTSYPVVRFCRRHRIPSVFVIQALIWDRIASGSNPYGRILTAAYRRANAFALRSADWHVAISAYIRAIAVEHGAPADRVRVIYNGVDGQCFSPARAPAKTTDVLYVGRFSREKGIDTLAEAIARLPPGLRILAVGDGVERASFERRTRDAGRPVACPGWVAHEKLPEVIRSTRLQVVPSHSEPQGVVVAEAMACGVPVVGSRVGGIPEMIVDGTTGWLVPPRSPGALADTIQNALRDDTRLACIAAQARQAAERFFFPRFEADTRAIYQEILGTAAGPAVAGTA